MGKTNQCTRIGWLSPAPRWSGSGFGVKKPYSLIFPHAPVQVQQWRCSWSSCLSRRLGVNQGKVFGPGRNGTVSVHPKWGRVRKQPGSVRSWSPHEDVRQVTLRKSTKSGSSAWQLCIGRGRLRTRHALPFTMWPTQWWGWPAPVWGAGLKRRECFLWVFPLSLGCSGRTVGDHYLQGANPTWLVWFRVRIIPSCECLLVWKVGLSHNTHS